MDRTRRAAPPARGRPTPRPRTTWCARRGCWSALYAAGLPVPRCSPRCDGTDAARRPVLRYGARRWPCDLTDTVPAELDEPAARTHRAMSWSTRSPNCTPSISSAAGWHGFGQPGRIPRASAAAVRRALETNATRPLPELDAVAEWLTDQPARDQRDHDLVHGDYRLGNMLFAPTPRAPRRDPRLGDGDTRRPARRPRLSLTATWAERDDQENPILALSAATRGTGFPTRDSTRARYTERTGRPTDDLRWYQVLALWKAAIFLEGVTPLPRRQDQRPLLRHPARRHPSDRRRRAGPHPLTTEKVAEVAALQRSSV